MICFWNNTQWKLLSQEHKSIDEWQVVMDFFDIHCWFSTLSLKSVPHFGCKTQKETWFLWGAYIFHLLILFLWRSWKILLYFGSFLRKIDLECVGMWHLALLCAAANFDPLVWTAPVVDLWVSFPPSKLLPCNWAFWGLFGFRTVWAVWSTKSFVCSSLFCWLP